MNKQIKLAAFAACVSTAIFTIGCGGPGAHTIDTGSSESITTLNHIDDKDWAAAANKLTISMMSMDGLFAPNADGSKKVIGVSRTINDTADMNVDMDNLLNGVKEPLINSGKATVTMINSLTANDPLAQRNVAQRDFATGDGTPGVRISDYSLLTKIGQNHATAGDVHQSTFYFTMTLTETRSGNIIWTKTAPITKIGSHASVGL